MPSPNANSNAQKDKNKDKDKEVVTPSVPTFPSEPAPFFQSTWSASSFFERLTSTNKLAQQEHFVFCRVSGLDGFEEAIHAMQTSVAFIAVSDNTQGYTELNNTPHTRCVTTIFLAMRHQIDNMQARQECLSIMHELFRQYMSVLIQEKTRVEEEHIYLDPRISFQEIDRYFLSGCACAFFQIAADVYTDLRYNQEEWY